VTVYQCRSKHRQRQVLVVGACVFVFANVFCFCGLWMPLWLPVWGPKNVQDNRILVLIGSVKKP